MPEADGAPDGARGATRPTSSQKDDAPAELAQVSGVEAEKALTAGVAVEAGVTAARSSEESRGVVQMQNEECKMKNVTLVQKQEAPDALAELKHKLANLQPGEVANDFIAKYVKSLESRKPGAGGGHEIPEELRGKLKYGPEPGRHRRNSGCLY